MKLSVIIVNYNVKYFLEQCLHSVAAAVKGMDAEVMVVDNASSDNSVAYLQPLFPRVLFIPSTQNLGFGRANNLALQQAKGEYVVFLNPDTIVPEDIFQHAIHFFETQPSAGSIGVRMLDGCGTFLPESKRAFPSVSATFYKATGLAALFPRSAVFNRYALGHLDETKNHRVEVLAGAFMMVRKALLDTTGAFDEQFFMYGEDIDLSFRLQQSGMHNWYVAETPIIHFKGESLQKWSANHVKVFYEAMIVFVKKHYKGNGAFLLRMMLIAGIRLKSIFSFLKGSVTGTQPGTTSHRRILLTGNGDEVSAGKILLTQSLPGNATFLLEADDSITAALLEQYCNQQHINTVVFCCGSLSYHTAIRLMAQMGKRYQYRFYARGSNCLVGSDEKSVQGEVIHSF